MCMVQSYRVQCNLTSCARPRLCSFPTQVLVVLVLIIGAVVFAAVHFGQRSPHGATDAEGQYGRGQQVRTEGRHQQSAQTAQPRSPGTSVFGCPCVLCSMLPHVQH